MNNQEKFRDLFLELEQITLDKNDSSFDNESFYSRLNELRRKGVYPYYSEYEFLDFCREYRNAISHELMENRYLDFSDECIEHLERIVEIVKHPFKAIDKANTNIFSVTDNDKVFATINKMNNCNYRYIPVYANQLLIGIFSPYVLSNLLTDNIFVDDETRIREIIEYVAKEKNSGNYSFISKKTYLKDALDRFMDDFDKNEKTRCVFITEHGNNEEKVLGLLTAWDIIRLLRSLV